MVILLDGPVHGGLFIPAIEPKLPDAVRTAGADEDVPALEPGGHIPDAVQDRVGGLFHIKAAMPPDDLNKAGR